MSDQQTDQIDFWYSIGSTYTYMTVKRLASVEAEHGIRFRWRPFNVRHVMVEQKNIPFAGKPVKSAYMWRDIERRSQAYGLSPSVPAPYPIQGLVLANQVAVVGAEQGWVEDYTRATYTHWFEHGKPAGEDPNLSSSLTEIGLDAEAILLEAVSPRIVDKLTAVTEHAMDIGVFGSPTFVVRGEVFWGDDRVEDAVKWAKSQTLR